MSIESFEKSDGGRFHQPQTALVADFTSPNNLHLFRSEDPSVSMSPDNKYLTFNTSSLYPSHESEFRTDRASFDGGKACHRNRHHDCDSDDPSESPPQSSPGSVTGDGSITPVQTPLQSPDIPTQNPYIPVDTPLTPITTPTAPIDTPTSPTTLPATTPTDTPAPTSNPTPGQTGTDLSSLFTAGDSGVTSQEMQHALDIANALPEDMKQALLANHIQMTVESGFSGGAQGQNTGTAGSFFADSGMADQSEVHELYEMYGQVTPNGAGSWSDSRAVNLADNGMTAAGSTAYNEGDLNDSIGNIQGDGDHMSNAFVADFFASHPGLNQDQAGQGTLALVAQDDPSLVAYIAQSQGLTQA